MSDPILQPKLSAYISAFNIVSNGLPYEGPLQEICAFFDETVIAVNTSSDTTLRALQDLAANPAVYPNLKIIETAFSYTDVTFDGAIKNAALQACEQSDAANRVYVQMDLDEGIIPYQKDLWRQYARTLLVTPNVECFLFPSLDLWGSTDTIRSDKPIGQKFRLHKAGLFRGVWRGAWLNPSHSRFDPEKSDSCELIDHYGNLVRFAQVTPPQYLAPSTCFMLKDYPTVIHKGYLDYEQRLRVNKAIWADHWKLRNGGEWVNVATRMEDLTQVPLVPHRLKLS